MIKKIKNEWDALNRKLEPNDIVWFKITKKGKKEMEYLNSLPELKETNTFYSENK